jgi:hypothetical protein
MKKPYRQSDGFYHVDGKKYKTLMGSREKVMNGTVHKTTGGLTRKDLVMNKWGRIVSANKYKTAKKEMRLQKHGFFAEKGKFGAVTRKVRGGLRKDTASPHFDIKSKDGKRENRKNDSNYVSESESDYEPKEENKGGASPKSSGKNNKSPAPSEPLPKPIPAWKPDRDAHHNSHMKEIITSLRLKENAPSKPNIKTDVSNYNRNK